MTMEDASCHLLLENLSAYLDGDLEEAVCKEIERHMAGCENCRIVYDSLCKTVYLYQTTSASPSVPSDVRERLYHCLDLDEFLKNMNA